MSVSDEVLAAASAVVRAFGDHDTEAYFAAFAPDATFVFHPEPGRPLSRDRYRELWTAWEADGFHVDACASSEAQVHVLTPEAAVFIHRVRTVVSGAAPLFERESIVFRREPDGTWSAVHEHLSPDPGAPDPGAPHATASGGDAQDDGHA